MAALVLSFLCLHYVGYAVIETADRYGGFTGAEGFTPYLDQKAFRESTRGAVADLGVPLNANSDGWFRVRLAPGRYLIAYNICDGGYGGTRAVTVMVTQGHATVIDQGRPSSGGVFNGVDCSPNVP